MANEDNRRAAVKQAMSRAKKLMQLESNGTLDKIAAAHQDGIVSSLDGGIMTEELMTTSRNRKTQAPVVSRRMGENASNVPQAIREAFMNNPIDDSALYDAMSSDGRDLSFLSDDIVEQRQVQAPQNIRQIVNEGIGGGQQYIQQPQVQVSQQVDYPMIRTIVEEIVRKYAVSLNKKIISESKQPTATNEINTIALGETFKFLDSKGNIYEAKLEKVSNIHDVKNKKKNVNG